MLINYKNEMMHDSASPVYRDPAEAVCQGQSVTLRFRTRLSVVTNVYVTLLREGFRQDYPMHAESGMFSVTISAPLEPGVYWYYFNVNVEGRIYYYGAEGGQTTGIGCVYTEPPPSFQLTVYDENFDTPDWLKNAVIYQIFPDRFARSEDDTAQHGIAYHKGKGRKAVYHESWLEKPLYKPLPGEKSYDPCDYFGGTLKGIEQSLGYIKSLGASVIYLNPIFEAASNHRYNTADYRKIDPVLGSEQDFRSLCDKAAGMGIRVVLDGVFSHTGSDSVYFNREGAYGEVGAYRSPQSPYYPWYTFEHYPDKYKSWWGFETLPEVNELNPDWQRFVVTDEDSVMKHWLHSGASGYRLDVADELPDEVIALMRAAVKQADSDAALIGEVWEDATTKYSYGAKRAFALGRALDSVMNYPLRSAVIAFLTGKQDAFFLKSFLTAQAVNYPKPMYYALMNLLASHDVERLRTALSVSIDARKLSREQQATFFISAAQNQKGETLQRLAAALQYALPGAPCVYYGDEKGVQGFFDPFNRMSFPSGEGDITEFYRALSHVRNGSDAMRTGKVAFFAPNDDCIGILRYVLNGKDAFGKPAQNGIYFTAVNRSSQPHRVVFDFLSHRQLITDEDAGKLRDSLNGISHCLLSGQSYTLRDALFEIEIKPYDVIMLQV